MARPATSSAEFLRSSSSCASSERTWFCMVCISSFIASVGAERAAVACAASAAAALCRATSRSFWRLSFFAVRSASERPAASSCALSLASAAVSATCADWVATSRSRSAVTASRRDDTSANFCAVVWLAACDCCAAASLPCASESCVRSRAMVEMLAASVFCAVSSALRSSLTCPAALPAATVAACSFWTCPVSSSTRAVSAPLVCSSFRAFSDAAASAFFDCSA